MMRPAEIGIIFFVFCLLLAFAGCAQKLPPPPVDRACLLRVLKLTPATIDAMTDEEIADAYHNNIAICAACPDKPDCPKTD